MRRFLLKLCCFALLVLAVAAGFEAYVESQPNIARYKHEWMLKHSNEVETLVLGHSHNLYGICPELLGAHAFNLAQHSQTYRYDDYLLKHYPMPRLKMVILNFDYFQLWEDFEHNPQQDFLAIRYRIYMDCDIHPRFSKYGFEVMSLPLVQKNLQSLYMPRQNRWSRLGQGMEYTKEAREEDWDNGQKRAEGNTYTDSTFVTSNEGFIRDILDYCRKRHIQVILLNTPVSDTFRQHEDNRQVAINHRVLRRLLNAYPEVTYLNFEDDKRFVADDFYDADHLNHEGATKLTAIVKETINSISSNDKPSEKH